MKTDKELTDLLRSTLHDEGVQGVKSYEWSEGEALYLGNPFTTTSYEQKAINKVLEVLCPKN